MAKTVQRRDSRVLKIKQKRTRTLNVGVLIFACIFLYFIVYTAIFLTRDKISVYEVVYGMTAESANKSYQGVILRDETVYTASQPGYLNCFVREGEKVSVGSSVCSLDESGNISELMEEKLSEENSLTSDDYKAIKEMISDYTLDYDDANFDEIYNFKIGLDAALLDFVNLNAINDILGSMGSEQFTIFNMMNAVKSGIVSYNIDGYEGKTLETLTQSDMYIDQYTYTNHKSGDLVAAGTPVYKTINSEKWSILISLDAEEVNKRIDDYVIKIRFIDEDITVVGDFEIVNIAGKSYGHISLEQYMIRFSAERFVNIQIVEEQIRGLKIPKTALVDMDFYLIPQSFATKGGNSSDVGFLVERYDEDGKMTVEYVSPKIYELENDMYYVSCNEFSAGENLIMEDENERYTISAKASLTGVYNINNGYCVFRDVYILAESTDYYIIESGTTYGLLVYDHIVLDSKTVKENQVVYY